MSKFKVGDKVKIRDDLIWDHYYGDIRCSSKRLECKGKIGEITKIAKTGSCFVHNHWFSEEMLEACDSKNTSKFKVGDKAMIIGPIFGKDSKYNGNIVTIKKVENAIFDDYKYSVIENDVLWDYFLLELVEEPCATTTCKSITPREMQEIIEKFGYIDETMDTSNRPVVDLSDHAVDSLYPNIITDILDNEEHCGFCKYSDNCHGISCHGGEPIEPPCAYQTAKDYIDNEELYRRYIDYYSDLIENKEERDMNKVVDLWYKRKKENIYKKYKNLEDEYVKEHYEIVKQYNELIEDFEKNLEDFCTEYSDITVNDDFVICKNADCNVYKYVIDEGVIRNDAKITYKEDKNEEYKELQLKYEDLNALLSMSDDLEYQQSILIEYGIINKKTKRMINEDNTN